MKTYHHNSNEFILDSSINITFHDLYRMSDKRFVSWVEEVRDTIRASWLEQNQPPSKTNNDETIIRQFERLIRTDVRDCLVVDGLSQSRDAILPKIAISAANPFFPNMGKTKDITSTDLTGMSQWDYFVEKKDFIVLVRELKKNLQRDSFYHFAPILYPSQEHSFQAKNGTQWIKKFTKNPIPDHDFFLDVGTLKKVNGRFPLTVPLKTVNEFLKAGIIRRNQTKFIKPDVAKSDLRARVRIYRKQEKIFPHFFSCLQRGLVAQGVNFPPIIAKYIYSTFTDDLKDQEQIVVYDPSAGFGGRLLGCLSVNQDRHIHYVGTDPNPDNWIEDLNMSRYEYMARFFNNNVRRKYGTTYEIFKLGSEVIREDRRFQKYKGKVDLIFTSPPYFAAEGYSEDKNQSFKKFPSYEQWRDGFLLETLRTCVDYLKPDRWLLWNIADVSFDGKYYPLERDTVNILNSLGMKYEKRLKMVLSGGIVGKKVSKFSRAPVTKNYCAINNRYRKYEPIFCFRKLP